MTLADVARRLITPLAPSSLASLAALSLAPLATASRAMLLAASLASLPLFGCAAITRLNVREERNYPNEDATPSVIRDRLADGEAILMATDAILASTPYSPGDPWIREIPLSDSEGADIHARLENAPPYEDWEHEVPIAKLYRTHIDEVLRRAAYTRRFQPAASPSLLDAIDKIAPGAPSIRGAWGALREALSARYAAAKASDAPGIASADRSANQALAALLQSLDKLKAARIDDDARRIIVDALTATSIALRANLESESLLAAVASQAMKANRIALRDFKVLTGGKPDLPLPGVPEYAEMLGKIAEIQSSAIASVTDALRDRTGTPIYRTAGWQLHENILLQGINVDLDAIRMRYRWDAQVLFFNQLGLRDASLQGYKGYTRRLEYDPKPVFYLGSRLIVTFDWLHVRNAGRLGVGFKTDRLASAGGTTHELASLGPQIGEDDFHADITDIGFDLLGLRTKAKISQFTAGELREIAVDPATGADIGPLRRGPLRLTTRELSLGYDIAYLSPEVADTYWVEDLVVGFRYLGTQLPHVAVDLVETDPDDGGAPKTALRESPLRAFRTDYYLGGAAARFGQGDFRVFSLFGDLGFYAGVGQASYSFLLDKTGADAPENRGAQSQAILVLNATTSLGARLRLTPRRMRVRLLCELRYQADFIGQTLVMEASKTAAGPTVGPEKRVDFGGLDVIHGPHLQVVGIF